MEFLRFFVVSGAGLLLDLAVAWGVATGLAAPLWLAAAMGFVTAAALTYLLHEFWTFRSGEACFSFGRLKLYAISLTLALAVRVAVVAILSVLFMNRLGALLILITGAGVSFGVNYATSKLMVFRSESRHQI